MLPYVSPRTPPAVVVAMVLAAVLVKSDFSPVRWSLPALLFYLYMAFVATQTLRRVLLYFQRTHFEKTQGRVVECTISHTAVQYPRLVNLRYEYLWNGVMYSGGTISPYFNFYSDMVGQVRQRRLSLEVGQALDVLVNTRNPREAYLEMERLPADIGYGVLSLGMVLSVAVLKYVFA